MTSSKCLMYVQFTSCVYGWQILQAFSLLGQLLGKEQVKKYSNHKYLEISLISAYINSKKTLFGLVFLYVSSSSESCESFEWCTILFALHLKVADYFLALSQVNLICLADIEPVSSKEFLGIYATIEYRFILKRLREMIITYS